MFLFETGFPFDLDNYLYKAMVFIWWCICSNGIHLFLHLLLTFVFCC